MSGSAAIMTEAEVARERVRRGVVWLDAKGADDARFLPWRLRLMDIRGGQVVSLVKLEFGTNDPLSLILRQYAAFAGDDGRVKWTIVRPAFFRKASDGDPIELGFDPSNGVSAAMLNVAWAQILSEYQLPTEIRHF